MHDSTRFDIGLFTELFKYNISRCFVVLIVKYSELLNGDHMHILPFLVLAFEYNNLRLLKHKIKANTTVLSIKVFVHNIDIY